VLFSKTAYDNILINLKDMNNALIRPSNDEVETCLIAERVVRKLRECLLKIILKMIYTQKSEDIFTIVPTKKFLRNDQCVSKNQKSL